MPISLATWLNVKMKGQADEVVIRERKRCDVCVSDMVCKNRRDIESTNTCMDVSMFMRVFACPCLWKRYRGPQSPSGRLSVCRSATADRSPAVGDLVFVEVLPRSAVPQWATNCL